MEIEEAIEDLKLFIKYANDSNNFREDYEQENCKGCANSIEIILQALEEKDQRIAELEKENKEWIQAFQEEKDLQFNILRKNQELEKMVDVMAEYIDKVTEEFSYENNSCMEICNKMHPITNCDVECTNCIKEYFEQKAKEVE